MLLQNDKDAVNGLRGVRQRLPRTSTPDTASPNHPPTLTKPPRSPKSTPRTISHLPLLLLYAIYSALFLLQIYLDNYHHPAPLMYSDIPSHPGEFIAERAMARLGKLTGIGPRVAGSRENEVLAVAALRKEMAAIMKGAHPVHSIEMDVQQYSGSFPLRFLDGLTNVYEKVQDVVVRLSSRGASPHSLLMNCHFDSVADSPGGSDDGAGCAVLLEILEVLSKSSERLEHNIIFLFNGAEENLMHGSHGFITKHKWAKEVRVFVNLEACGAGGREVLFQSGPNSPWIMEVYAKSVLHPFASSMAQEVFESGLIPGDTDFRVFRDFGNVSGNYRLDVNHKVRRRDLAKGIWFIQSKKWRIDPSYKVRRLDFAWSTNGYVYHTKYDDVDQIPLGALQRTGENMLALAKGLANAEEMKDVSRHRAGNMIYFDLLGLYLVRWSEEVGTMLNISTVVLSVLLLAASCLDARRKEVPAKMYLEYLARTLGAVLLGGTCSIGVVVCVSGFLSVIGKSMSWYGRPIWVVFLYAVPSTVANMGIQHHFSEKFLKVIRCRMVLFQMYFDVYQSLWTAILLLCVVLRIRSGYIAWMWVFGPCLGILIHRLWKSPLDRGPDWKWLAFLLASTALPVVQHISMQVGCLSLFIPIMGRSGASLNSEMVIALFANLTFSMLFAHVTPIVVLLTNPKKVFTGLTAVFMASLVLLLCTPLGFPYSGDYLSPRPQRYMILHTQRTFFNRLGEQISTESGYWVVDHDYNSPHTVKAYVGEMREARLIDEDCEEYLYCGLPYLMPVLSFIKKTHWIPAHPPVIEKDTSLKVVWRGAVGENVERITLEIKGPDHMGLIVSPKANVAFVRWSLNDEGPVKGPTWKGQDTFFVYYASSSEPESWLVSFDFKVGNYNETLMDLALTSHFLHGPRKTQPSFKRMLAQFPPWTTVTSWTATYKSFVL